MHFSSSGHNEFSNDTCIIFIDKADPANPRKRENFWRKTLKTMALYGLNIEESVWPRVTFISLDCFKTFDFPVMNIFLLLLLWLLSSFNYYYYYHLFYSTFVVFELLSLWNCITWLHNSQEKEIFDDRLIKAVTRNIFKKESLL